ncbi:MAG TPA: hypothetical protein VMW49_03240 [Candidatus Dormibacteraeota bacterium]|nr:hypothetical protein [Candidatus Dormibacteraeota bacterium]
MSLAATVLGLAAALGYGASDVLAGMWSRRASFVAVALVAQVAALVVVLVAAAAVSRGAPAAGAVAWGAVSGIGAALGTLFLYRGLGRGRMGVVAPLSALGAAVLPAALGLALGERPPLTVLLGLACAVPAIGLVSTEPRRPVDGRPVDPGRGRRGAGTLDGLAAGVGFALLFICLERAGHTAGLWPVAAGQVSSLVWLTGAIAVRGAGVRLSPTALAGSALAGALAALASICYDLATGPGRLAVAAVLTSLYPAITVILARLVFGERVGRVQAVGLGLAAAAVTLIVGH